MCCAEIIKYGLIRDAPLFAWLEANMERLLTRDPEVGEAQQAQQAQQTQQAQQAQQEQAVAVATRFAAASPLPCRFCQLQPPLSASGPCRGSRCSADCRLG